MTMLKPEKIDLSKINSGNEWEIGQAPTPDTFNAPLKASAYAQALATNQPNNSQVDQEGTPSVEIEEMANGTPRFVFKNLKPSTKKLEDKIDNKLDKTGGLINGDLFFASGDGLEFQGAEQGAEARVTGDGIYLYAEQGESHLTVQDSVSKAAYYPRYIDYDGLRFYFPDHRGGTFALQEDVGKRYQHIIQGYCRWTDSNGVERNADGLYTSKIYFICDRPDAFVVSGMNNVIDIDGLRVNGLIPQLNTQIGTAYAERLQIHYEYFLILGLLSTGNTNELNFYSRSLTADAGNMTNVTFSVDSYLVYEH